MTSKATIIIVTYNPIVSDLKRNIRMFMDECLNIIIINNYYSEVSNQNIKKLEKEFKNLTVFLLNENIGIGSAQNKAIKMLISSKENKNLNIIFFDQDSYLSCSSLSKLVYDFNKYNKKDPKLVMMGSNLKEYYEDSNDPVMKVDEIISSGSITKLKYFDQEEVGLFFGELFIDFIDYEWCWRAEKKGYKVAVDRSIFLHHQLSGELKRRFGKQITPANRLYYVFRNLIIALKATEAPLTRRILWTYRATKTLIFQVLLVDHRLQSAKKILLGVKDGWKYRDDMKVGK